MDKRLSRSRLIVFVLNMFIVVSVAALFVTYMAGYREFNQWYITYLFLMTLSFHIAMALYALSRMR